MIIKDFPKEFSTGMACSLSLAYQQQVETTAAGDELPPEIEDSVKSLIIGLLLSGALNVPYTPPPEPVSTWELDGFYYIYTKALQESYDIDLLNFYKLAWKSIPTNYNIDLDNFYTVEVHTPEEET